MYIVLDPYISDTTPRSLSSGLIGNIRSRDFVVASHEFSASDSFRHDPPCLEKCFVQEVAFLVPEITLKSEQLVSILIDKGFYGSFRDFSLF